MYKHYFEQMECFIKWELPVRKCLPQVQMTELEQLCANLSGRENKSLLTKHLTPERYKLLKDKYKRNLGTHYQTLFAQYRYFIMVFTLIGELCLSVCIVSECLANESSKEINKTTADGLTYLGRKNINRTKPESIEINTLERRTNTTYFNITEQRTDNEQTYDNNIFFVWSSIIVGTVVTPVTLSIIYVLFRFCILTKFSQNLRVADEEQRNFLHSKQATK